MCIPCTYLLDGAGKPLEVIAVALPVEQFLDKLQRTIQVYVYPLIIWLVRRYIMQVTSPKLSKVLFRSEVSHDFVCFELRYQHSINVKDYPPETTGSMRFLPWCR